MERRRPGPRQGRKEGCPWELYPGRLPWWGAVVASPSELGAKPESLPILQGPHRCPGLSGPCFPAGVLGGGFWNWLLSFFKFTCFLGKAQLCLRL